jgi:hypothetical protein
MQSRSTKVNNLGAFFVLVAMQMQIIYTFRYKGGAVQMQKQKQKYYLIVEAKADEHILKECSTQLQVAEWLNVKQSAVNQAIKNNDIIKGRYKIEVIEADAD